MTQVHRICLEERTQINTDLSPKQINWKTDASSRFSCSSWFAGQFLHSMVECCSCTSDICWTQLVTLCSELMVEIQTVSKNTTNVLFLLKRWTCFCELTCQGFFKSSKPFAFQPFRSYGECETTLLLSSMIYVSMYTECAGKDTDGHCCLAIRSSGDHDYLHFKNNLPIFCFYGLVSSNQQSKAQR